MLFFMDYVHLTSSNMTKSDLHEVELANGTMDCKDQNSLRLKKSRKSAPYLSTQMSFRVVVDHDVVWMTFDLVFTGGLQW